MNEQAFDLVVIGSGPAGQKGAICAAKLGKRVALIERPRMIGGVCVHTGTIPSKSLREAIFQLTGFSVKAFYGDGRGDISIPDVALRVHEIVARETEVIHSQLKDNGVVLFQGAARFSDPYAVEVHDEAGTTVLRGDHVLVACGTRPARSPNIAFDGKRVVDGDQLYGLHGLPREIIIVGAGVVGLEYASFFARSTA